MSVSLCAAYIKFSTGKLLNSGNFQVRRVDGTDKGIAFSRKNVAERLALVLCRNPESPGAPVDFRAVADRMDVGKRRLKPVIRDNGFVHLNSAVRGGMDPGTDSRGEKKNTRFLHASVGKGRFHAVRGGTRFQLRGGNAEAETESRSGEFLQQNRRLRLVELARQKPVHEFDHGDCKSPFAERPGGLESEQSAADHNGVLRRFRARNETVRVMQRAEREGLDAFDAFHRRDECVRAAGQHQLVPGEAPARRGPDFLCGGIDFLQRFAGMGFNPLRPHGFRRSENQLFPRNLARDVIGQAHFCVKPAGVGVEQQHICFRQVLLQSFCCGAAGLSASGDNDFHAKSPVECLECHIEI